MDNGHLNEGKQIEGIINRRIRWLINRKICPQIQNLGEGAMAEKICSKCDVRYPISNLFCSICGSKLEFPTAPPPSRRENYSSRGQLSSALHDGLRIEAVANLCNILSWTVLVLSTYSVFASTIQSIGQYNFETTIAILLSGISSLIMSGGFYFVLFQFLRQVLFLLQDIFQSTSKPTTPE